MINLAEVSMVLLTKAQRDEQRQKVWDSCIAHGRAAFTCGLRLKDCPPFRDNDMAVSWRMGWRYAYEERKRKA